MKKQLNYTSLGCCEVVDLKLSEDKNMSAKTLNKLNKKSSAIMPQEYRQIMNRAMNVLGCELWDIGDRLMFAKKFNNLIYFDPLFVYTPGKGVAVYYNFTDPKQSLQPLIDFLEKNMKWLWKEKEKFYKDCNNIRKILKEKSLDHVLLFRLLKEVWPIITMANTLCITEIFKVNHELKDFCVAIREESDDVLHPGTDYWIKIITKLISGKKNIDRILYSEFIKNKLLSKYELKRRAGRWFYHKGKIGFNLEQYCQQNNIILIKDKLPEEIKEIFGKSTYRSVITGKVKLIFELKDLNKLKKNDILVAPMTTPDMIIGIKKAAAIITDEGGITCHAAIVSRELKKPCIVGTKIATEVLRDGDLVEVDADKGIVKKI